MESHTVFKSSHKSFHSEIDSDEEYYYSSDGEYLSASGDDCSDDEPELSIKCTERVYGEMGPSVWFEEVKSADTVAVISHAGLHNLFQTTHGKHWKINENWLNDSLPRDWHGVSIDADGNISKLIMKANDLTGKVELTLRC